MSNEHIWSGDFGNDYNKRNDSSFAERGVFFSYLSGRYDFANVLEVGCNKAHNLNMIAKHLDDRSCAWGLDINKEAVGTAKALYPDLNLVHSSGLDIPFKDDYFDMVFTAGVLIHQSPATVEHMMQEIIRVSGKWIMAIEYAAETFVEVPYRGLSGALFKGPFGDVYEKRYGLRLIETIELGKDKGFDNCTAWILGKY